MVVILSKGLHAVLSEFEKVNWGHDLYSFPSKGLKWSVEEGTHESWYGEGSSPALHLKGASEFFGAYHPKAAGMH